MMVPASFGHGAGGDTDLAEAGAEDLRRQRHRDHLAPFDRLRGVGVAACGLARHRLDEILAPLGHPARRAAPACRR